jgi:hypothetical protein
MLPTPTPFPRIEIDLTPIREIVQTAITDAPNDPIFQFVIASVIVAGIIGLLVAGIRRALRS